MANKPWTAAEIWKLQRAIDLYESQYKLIDAGEDFVGRTIHSLEGKGKEIKSKGWSVPRGTEKLPLRIETHPDEVMAVIDNLQTHTSRFWIPSALSTPSGFNTIRSALLRHLKGERRYTIIELANRLNISPKNVEDNIKWLQDQQFLVDVSLEDVGMAQPDPSYKSSITSVSIDRLLSGGWVKFGVLSDPHVGSRWTRWDVINTMFDIFQREGIREVYVPGNVCEGESRVNKEDVKIWGFERQIKCFVTMWPQHDGMVTKYITADEHEGWYIRREGVDFGRRMEQTARDAGREDLIFLGHVEADVKLVSSFGSERVLRLVHPGGGTAYATSYAPQKIVESYQGGEKPHILLIGHYHKQGNFQIRGVHTVLCGCCADQSIHMRKNKINAEVGGWIIKVQFGQEGEIVRFSPEWFGFYDRGFYEKHYEVTYE